VKQLRSWGHLSPLEHASFTFYLEGVSRAMTHQLVRHRIASYSQRSQRYVEEGDFDYIVPPQIQGKTIFIEGSQVEGSEFFRQTMEEIGERYRALDRALGGGDESSHEDARYLLPNACETKIFVTMNARQLLHFSGSACATGPSGRYGRWRSRCWPSCDQRIQESLAARVPSVSIGVGVRRGGGAAGDTRR